PYCGQQAPSIVTVVTGEDDPVAMLQKASFKLWPNPTTGKFILEQTDGSPDGNVAVAIYGMHGEKVMTKELTGQKQYELSIEGFPAGLYFVKVVAGEYTGTIKLIKTN
ncbi:MAG: T9SS type A sorting domain-containing protein, partial [Bacteroidota bacterium]